MRIGRARFHRPEDILADVRGRLEEARDERVDILTFVPDGEPTLDEALGREIGMLKGLGVPVGVITNASLLWLRDVREDLCLADWVSVKVDSVIEGGWRRLNRPHGRLRLPDILDGIREFAEAFTGELVTETMLVSGVNDGEDSLEAVAGFLSEIRPRTAYLSIPTRPPAETGALAPSPGDLARASAILAGRLGRVELLTGYEGDSFASTGELATDILSIASVHPMRREALEALLEGKGEPWAIVEDLLARGDLVRRVHEGREYFLASGGVPRDR